MQVVQCGLVPRLPPGAPRWALIKPIVPVKVYPVCPHPSVSCLRRAPPGTAKGGEGSSEAWKLLIPQLFSGLARLSDTQSSDSPPCRQVHWPSQLDWYLWYFPVPTLVGGKSGETETAWYEH